MVKACLSVSKNEQEVLVRNWEDEMVIDDMDYSSMRLVPFFFHKNQQSGIITKYDKRLKVIYKYWWLKTQHLSNQLIKVHVAFKNAGIAVVVIKGASIMTSYERPEFRPMADFDLLIPITAIKATLLILENMGYLPDKIMEVHLRKNPNLFADFAHSIECVHQVSDTRIDLHWKIGSLCSIQFTNNLWLNLDNYEAMPNALKPQLAYEVFMIIIHAVMDRSRDNLNWIIDIAMLNRRNDRSFWEEARQLALIEKKEDLFDYGCFILLKYGVYAPEPVKSIKPRTLIYFNKDQQIGTLKLYANKINNFLIYLKYLYPNLSAAAKFYQGMRRIKLFFLFKGLKPIKR